MDLFKVKFINEAIDLVSNLEESVLSLENNKEDSALIEQIFRVMHTFKGSSNMFGFDKIGEFTHHLETIYDLVRTKQISISAEIVNITLQSVDHIKSLLGDEKLQNSENIINHNLLLHQITTIVEVYNKNTEISPIPVSVDALENRIKTYHISFQPYKSILLKGNNPLFLIEELLLLGEGKAIPYSKDIPSLQELKSTSCYVSWDIFLASKETENTLREVFMFAEDECDLLIKCISQDKNLFEDKKFLLELDKINSFDGAVNIGEILKSSTHKNFDSEIQIKSQNKINSHHKEASNIKVSSDKLDELMSLVSELVTTQARLSLFSEESHNAELNIIAENIEKISRRLRDNTFNICLVPIGSMHTRFKRLVRDLSSELGKEVDFNVEGSETELDKTIVESITDPLLHIIRNSMDHGIESPEERIKSGKPLKGKILLKAYYSGANVHIEIVDDGKGLDIERIKQKGVEKGLIAEGSKLSKKEIFDLLFLPGFSTSEKVTELSGRGVGMDVVKRNIRDIRGEVALESTLGEGTKITIILPLTLSIIDGLLVRINQTHFIIPLSAVEKCYEVKHEVFVNNFKELIVLEGEQLPYIYLREEFSIEENCPSIEQVVVVKHGDKKIGISVDSIIGEYQAVLKPLGKLYRSVQIISGATILGDGSVALVMDTNQMIKQLAVQHKTKEIVYEQ
jgi:two-component system chemotaxis sensor kinase CheA